MTAPTPCSSASHRPVTADVLDCTPQTARAYAPLVQRAMGIIAALGSSDRVQVRGAAEAAPAADDACVILRAVDPRDAADRPGLRHDGGRRFTLAYCDSTSEAALGALIACTAAPGAPIAADPESLSVLALADRLAASEIPVLLGGPTGTGKEVLSRFIHDRSPRRHGPFIAVNCAAMPEAMLEALLFGHQKGAFTGATAASEGFFRAADGGTLLLDEIAEMPLSLQAKLLRALQESEVVPIGATRAIKVDVRVIATANRDLPTEVAEGRFRADLYYRLNVFPLNLRPLQDRPDDIAPLAFTMMLRHSPAGQAVPWLSDEAVAMLRQHSWPGNVRELENVMRRALLLCGPTGEHDANEITEVHIRFDRPARLVTQQGMVPALDAGTSSPAVMRRKLANIVQHSEAQAIIATLAGCDGSRTAAARQLGISERTLRYRLAAFREAGIDIAPSAADRHVTQFGAIAGVAR